MGGKLEGPLFLLKKKRTLGHRMSEDYDLPIYSAGLGVACTPLQLSNHLHAC